MATITENPPSIVVKEIKALNAHLDKSIPAKTNKNLLIATWNLRAFGELNENWIAEEKASPKRDLQSLLSIIQVIQRFDIIAIQEVKGNLKCLRETMRILGNDWSFIMTDVTKGDKGNGERLAFVFNNKKVNLSGLACELVVPDEQLKKNISAGALDSQFARTPYAVSFRANDKTFVLLTLHVTYAKNVKSRVPELKAIAEWMFDWALDLKDWGHSLITLGDFNIEREGDVAYDAFVSTGLFVPDDLKNINRTIFDNISFYDQIAWFRDKKLNPQITLKYIKGGAYNFKDKVLVSRKYTDKQISFRISDHLPLWAEFEI